jgi:hypothetical protein
MKHLAFVAILSAPILSSCAFMDAKPSVVSSDQQGVTIKFKEGHVDDATSKAEQICGTQQRSARLERITPQGKDTRIASFTCE